MKYLSRDLVLWMFTMAWYMMTSSNETIFRVTGPLCGEFTGPGEFPAQRPATRGFDVFFDLHWINDWVNNRQAGDLYRYRTHYDGIVMICNVCPESVSCHNTTGTLTKHQVFVSLTLTQLCIFFNNTISGFFALFFCLFIFPSETRPVQLVSTVVTDDLWSLLLTWFNFNPSMRK